MAKERYCLAVVLTTALAGCPDHRVVKPSFRPVTVLPPGVEWSGAVTLIGDNQKFHIGNLAFLFRSGFTDRKVSHSAVRVPQQDLFGDAQLELAAREPRPVVHLGDALDLSCADEWNDFSAMMDTAGNTAWFWTPGNHDGYFFGNFVGPKGQWDDACFPSTRINKGEAITAYISKHLARYAGTSMEGSHGEWKCPSTPADCHGLRRVTWVVEDEETYYRSYVVQELDLGGGKKAPRVSLILVDTNAYDRPPRIAPDEPLFHYAAGQEGRLGVPQLAVITAWTKQAVAEGRIVILAGHHNFNSLDEESRNGLGALIGPQLASTYISAHTHWGQYYSHIGDDGYSWLEPNLGSIIDYDSEYATLEVGATATARFVRMSRQTIASYVNGARAAELGIGCSNPEWLARPDDSDFYTRYMRATSPKPTTVDKLYYATMLAALDRYWRCVPTADTASPMPSQCNVSTAACKPDSEVHASIEATLKTNDLKLLRAKSLELLELDRGRKTDPCLRREYRVCQAQWGSEYELREYLTPPKGDDTFEVDTPHMTVVPVR